MTDSKPGCLFSLQINIQFGDLFLSPLLYSAMFQTLQTHCSLCFAIHKQSVASFGAGFLSLGQTGWLRVFLGTWWSATHKTQQQFKFSACWIITSAVELSSSTLRSCLPAFHLVHYIEPSTLTQDTLCWTLKYLQTATTLICIFCLQP